MHQTEKRTYEAPECQLYRLALERGVLVRGSTKDLNEYEDL